MDKLDRIITKAQRDLDRAATRNDIDGVIRALETFLKLAKLMKLATAHGAARHRPRKLAPLPPPPPPPEPKPRKLRKIPKNPQHLPGFRNPPHPWKGGEPYPPGWIDQFR